MTTAQIIHQSDLIAETKRRRTDIDPDFASRLDPDGIAVVSIAFLHNDGPDYRVVALCKILNHDEPVEAIFTIMRRKIIQSISFSEDGSWTPLPN